MLGRMTEWAVDIAAGLTLGNREVDIDSLTSRRVNVRDVYALLGALGLVFRSSVDAARFE